MFTWLTAQCPFATFMPPFLFSTLHVSYDSLQDEENILIDYHISFQSYIRPALPPSKYSSLEVVHVNLVSVPTPARKA